MELKAGLSALVTGGASGIGKALSLALAAKGIFVTVVDFSEEKGKEVASLVQKENAKFHSNLGFPSVVFVKCDVSNTGDITAAFEKHLATFGGLDICINNAGIGTFIPFDKDQTDGTHTWRKTINVNLVAVIDCTRLAIKTMEALKKPGVIINMGSSSGLYPFYTDPIYSGSKGGVVQFTRSLVPYKLRGIRINVLCPEFVETEMGSKVGSKFISLMDGYVSMEMVVKGAFELITDESKAGSCLWITNRRGMEYWPTPAEEAKYLVRRSSLRKRAVVEAPFNFQLPESFEKLVVHTLSHNFRNATSMVRAPLRLPIEPHSVLVKIIYAGVNASDVNYSSGRYFSGKTKDIESRLPFDCGFEAGQMESGKVVLVTAAAGGTGQFAVQLAKLAGNTVVATCGGAEKAKHLKELGVDRVIDYKAEDVKTVLRKEYPKGVDIIYESVGGDMFDLCLNALAVYGRLIVIGMISQAGFFLVQYSHLWQEHLDKLVYLFSKGKLKVNVLLIFAQPFHSPK
ncbi:hypothetical protein C1H46_035114 [Malus baccata]|uniref:Enoyl reductase (ER) domain-containing protein n=1 Tax=Malus baccata TaxID=106549 RepID=A0A540KYR7_MALBA|nr:hypothetical protein C1H46_035114 [Malus baccata]